MGGAAWTPLPVSARSLYHIYKMVLVRQTKTEVHTGSWVHPEAAGGGCKPTAGHGALSLCHPGKTPSSGISPPCSPSTRCREDTRQAHSGLLQKKK